MKLWYPFMPWCPNGFGYDSSQAHDALFLRLPYSIWRITWIQQSIMTTRVSKSRYHIQTPFAGFQSLTLKIPISWEPALRLGNAIMREEAVSRTQKECITGHWLVLRRYWDLNTLPHSKLSTTSGTCTRI